MGRGSDDSQFNVTKGARIAKTDVPCGLNILAYQPHPFRPGVGLSYRAKKLEDRFRGDVFEPALDG